jgi:hypothetical protein
MQHAGGRHHTVASERRLGVGCEGRETKLGLREGVQVFVWRMAFGARHLDGREEGRRDTRRGCAAEKRRDRRPKHEPDFGKLSQKSGRSSSACVHGRASVFSQNWPRRPGLRGPRVAAGACARQRRYRRLPLLSSSDLDLVHRREAKAIASPVSTLSILRDEKVRKESERRRDKSQGRSSAWRLCQPPFQPDQHPSHHTEPADSIGGH